jgi:Carboxypeptidase regulatory-like domain/TonB dependent receptor
MSTSLVEWRKGVIVSGLPLRLISLVGLFIALMGSASAQYRAGIQGTVLDPQGAAVEDAKVTVTAKDTKLSQETTTDVNGVYSVTRLAPGLYTVTAEKSGFKKQILDDVNVPAEQMTALNMVMSLGAVNESVTVNGEELPAIDTESGNISGALSSREIKALPIVNSDPYQLARLAPGVFGDGATGAGGGGTNLPGSNQASSTATSGIYQTENQPQIIANGTRNNGNSYQIDGMEVNSLAWGGSAVITPNQDAVKEVQIQANPYSAENGRNSGAQVLVVTQNGSNVFHGDAFLRIHRPGLNAYQPWSGPNTDPVPVGAKAPYGHQRDNNRFNMFGGSVGGPIRKDKIFFFFSYNTLRNNTNGAGDSQWFETPQFFDAVKTVAPNSVAAKYGALYPKFGPVFSQVNQVSCAQVNLPATQCQVVTDASGKYLGLDLGSPRAGAALGTFDPTYGGVGTPYGVGGGLDGIPDVYNVVVASPQNQTATQWNGRIDYQVTSRDLATFTIFWVPNVNNGFFNGPARGTNIWSTDRLNYSMAALWNHTFAPTLINEARFNVTRWYYDEVKSNPNTPFGLPADQFVNHNAPFGGISMKCCPVFGAPGPGVFYQTTYNIRDTLNKVYRSHSLKFGVDVYKEQDNDVTTWAGIPQYDFNNLWDFASDAPINEGENGFSFDPRTGRPTSSVKYIRSNIYAFFVQDDWKVKSNLTLNFGMRWEYFGPIHEKFNNLSNVVLGGAVGAFTGPDALTGLKIKTGGNLYNSSYNNWGPQFGFAWSPIGNRFVLRGGAGIGYNRLQEAVTLNGRFNPPLVANHFWTAGQMCGGSPCIVYGAADNPHDIFGFPVNPAAIQTFDPNTGLPTTGTVNVTAFDQNMPTPIVFRYSLMGQYDLGHQWVASLGYQGSQSRHFMRQVNNLNWLLPSNLNPSVSGVDWYTSDANAHYNALLAEINHKFARSFQIDAQYTYSKCMDHGSQDYASYQYPFNQAAAYGACDYDVTDTFKAFGVWDINYFFHQHDWKQKILGGWQLSGIYTFRTGFPFSPYYNVNVVSPDGSNNLGCGLLYAGSGYCNAIPAAYLGGAGSSSSNKTFETAFGNFSNLANNPTAYFALPSLSATGIPSLPAMHRNIFRGPRYHDIDLALQKSFGLPNTKFLGENAQITIRGDFYNLFNTLNLNVTSAYPTLSGAEHMADISLDPVTNQIWSVTPDPNFGRAAGAYGSRVIEFQFRFQF